MEKRVEGKVVEDKSIIRIVYEETRFNYHITACLSRYGGLTVLAIYTIDGSRLPWQGENILDARNWVDKQSS